MKGRFKESYAVLFGIGILIILILSSVQINFAADETSNIAVSDDGASEENAKRENSWRYREGQLIPQMESFSRNANPNAWSKVDGYYVNDQGEQIPNAIKKGIDVSEHQGQIDWNLVKASDIEFAFIRCGYGDDETNQDDKYWEYNSSECERLDIPYGVYLYSYAQTIEQAKSEASHALRLLNGRKLSYPVYLDMEDNSTINVSADLKGKIAKIFCDTLSDAGYSVGIYANLGWWTDQLTSPVFNNGLWYKWVAQHNSTCDYDGRYDLWQATDAGQVQGISGRVDLNFLFEEKVIIPPAVNNLTAVSAGKQRVKISWEASSGAEGYLIYGQKNGVYGYVSMTTQGTTYTDIKALESDYNFYWIFPYVKNHAGKMIPGNCTKYVYAKGICPPVTNLKAASGQGEIRLTWGASVGAEGYLVYGKTTTGKYGYVGMTTRGLTYTDKKASTGEYNFYWVFPYYKNESGKMVVGGTTKYTYGKAR